MMARNEYGLRLEDYMPTGWDNVWADAKFIAIDRNGSAWGYKLRPIPDINFHMWIFSSGDTGARRLTGSTDVPVENWLECIWEWQETIVRTIGDITVSITHGPNSFVRIVVKDGDVQIMDCLTIRRQAE